MNICCDFRVAAQVSSKDARQSCFGDIVLGRAETAGGDYDFGGSHSAMHGGGDVGCDVTHDLHPDNRDAQGVETAGYIARIGVGDASQQDFVADDYYVSFH